MVQNLTKLARWTDGNECTHNMLGRALQQEQPALNQRTFHNLQSRQKEVREVVDGAACPESNLITSCLAISHWWDWKVKAKSHPATMQKPQASRMCQDTAAKGDVPIQGPSTRKQLLCHSATLDSAILGSRNLLRLPHIKASDGLLILPVRVCLQGH